jgi:NAD(P)-dependent dehydrogenase (short-subunit alcohol dehydrogenase family)
MTRTLANEWTPLGIGVNAIAPGYFYDQDNCASTVTRRRR